MLGPWVVPFKNYVRQFHPISKMATTGEHSLTLDTGKLFQIFSSETTWTIETKRGHNVPCKIVSDIMTFHPRWRYWEHSLKFDFFLKFIFSERGRGVKVQKWPHILLKNNASHRIKTIY